MHDAIIAAIFIFGAVASGLIGYTVYIVTVSYFDLHHPLKCSNLITHFSVEDNRTGIITHECLQWVR